VSLVESARNVGVCEASCNASPFVLSMHNQHATQLSVLFSYSRRKITPSLGYVTVRGEGNMEMARESKTAKNLSEHVYLTETIFPLLIATQSVAFWYTDFCTTLYFVNQRNYKTLAMQAHALTRKRYFYSPRTGLSRRMCYCFAIFPSHPRVYL
jgi:hypothetical protein